MATEENSSEFDRKFLELMAEQFITLFKGDGETRNGRLQDAYNKAVNIMSGVQHIAYAVKRSAPHILD